jgi:hypothetical protein
MHALDSEGRRRAERCFSSETQDMNQTHKWVLSEH